MKANILFTSIAVLILATPHISNAENINSNLWPVHRNEKFGFRVSYPPDWIFPTIKGGAVKFSVSPATGSGNCNILASPSVALSNLTHSQLNEEIEATPLDKKTFSYFLGLPENNIRIVQVGRERIVNTSAILATIETRLDSLEGKYYRKQYLMITAAQGLMLSMNCGSSNFTYEESVTKFANLSPIFMKVFGSFYLTKLER